MNNFWSYTSRKFTLVVITELLNAFLLWQGKLTSDTYSMILVGTVGAYIAGNVFQKTKQNYKEEM